MPKIFKICLFVAIFLTSGTFTYAAFNYDSVNNRFLLDSILKTGGDYILVGDALSGYCENSAYISQSQCQANGSQWHEKLKKIDSSGNIGNSTAFFAVSNNLIFPASGSFASGVRQISKNEFSTNAITVSSANNFEIVSVGGNDKLVMQAPEIEMNHNFRINNSGLSFLSNISPVAKNIHINNVVADEVNVLGGGKLFINNTNLILSAGGTANAIDIYFGNNINPLCEKKDLLQTDSYSVHGKFMQDVSGERTSCDNNFFVYDINVNSTPPKMVCCRYPY